MNKVIIPAASGTRMDGQDVIAWAIRETTMDETLDGHPDNFVVEPIFAPAGALLPY